MPFLSIVFGLILIGLGLDGYQDLFGLVCPEQLHSVTSLIPAFLGGVLVILGLLSRGQLRKHMMHLAAMAGLLGFLAGAGMGLPKLSSLLSGTAERPAAVRLQLWMGGICLLFVLICVRSFIMARRARGQDAITGSARPPR